jgi:hypothetical protein
MFVVLIAGRRYDNQNKYIYTGTAVDCGNKNISGSFHDRLVLEQTRVFEFRELDFGIGKYYVQRKKPKSIN